MSLIPSWQELKRVKRFIYCKLLFPGKLSDIIFFPVNLEEAGPAKKKEKKVQEIVEPVVGGGVKISTIAPKRPPGEKATDDFHYEKFKKQFRRH